MFEHTRARALVQVLFADPTFGVAMAETIDLTKSDDEQEAAPQPQPAASAPQIDVTRDADAAPPQDDQAASLALARQLQAEEDAAAGPPQPRRVDERPAKRPRSIIQIERVDAAGGILDPSILSRVDAIVQQSNCVGCDGRGLAAAIAEKLPYGDTYKDRTPMPPARKFAIPEDRATPGSITVRRGNGPAVVSMFAQFEMGTAMKYRRVRPEPAGGDTKANRLRWFKEGLAKLAAEPFRRVAFPREIGCALAGGDWSQYEAAIAEYGASNPEVEILIVTWGGGGGGRGRSFWGGAGRGRGRGGRGRGGW